MGHHKRIAITRPINLSEYHLPSLISTRPEKRITMVKSVVGEESNLKFLEDRLFESSVPSQVGIIVGKLSPNSDRGFIYDLIPTPLTDSGSEACVLGSAPVTKKGSKPVKKELPPSVIIDTDWVAEHARQVSRMLVGGMNVVGVYLWIPEATYKSIDPSILLQTIKGVAQASSWYGDTDERLLLHISYSPSRWTCRTCTVGSGNMRPSDFKMGKLLASLHTYRCMYNFEMRLPIFHVGASESSTFRDVLRIGIACHAKELQNARALVDGKLVDSEKYITSDDTHTVELLLPFMNYSSTEASSLNEVAGLVVFTGSICATSYLGPREPISEAISDLKGDIISSLQSRLDIIYDDADDKVDMPDNHDRELRTLQEQRKPCDLQFPRRVLIPKSDGTLICDYLQSTETVEDVKDRCKEMMAMESPIETDTIMETETEATLVTTSSFWDLINGGSTFHESKNMKTSTRRDSSESSVYAMSNLVPAFLIFLAAVLIGVAIGLFGK